MLDDYGSVTGYLVKGHNWDAKALADRINHDYGAEVSRSGVETYMRKVPSQRDGWAYQYVESKRGRGAFACTIVG